MSDRLSDIEARLQQVEEAIRALGAAEQAGLLTRQPAEPAPSPLVLPAPVDAAAFLTLSGRTLMVLCGAFALRALTESGRLPATSGIALGIAYALVWLAVADRAGVRRPLSGFYHGLAAILIGLPLLWEASAHFGLLSAEASAAALAGLCCVALWVASHRGLQNLAGLAVCGTVAAMTAFIVQTHRPLPFAGGLLLLGAATLWVAERRGWQWLRWPPALAADILLAGLISRASTVVPLDRPAIVVGLQLLLASIYAGVVAWQTLALGRPARLFEILQVPLSLLVGLGGAIVVTGRWSAPAHGVIAAAMLVLAAGCYVAAFGVLPRRPAATAVFNYYAALALVLILAGTATLMAGAPRIAMLAVLSVAVTALAFRFSHPILGLHGAAFTLAAAAWSGLVKLSLITWLTPSGWPPITETQILAIITAGVCAAIPRTVAQGRSHAPSPALERAARLLVALVLCSALGALAVRVAALLLHRDVADLSALAMIRTLTLAFAALGLAALGRFVRFLEFGWLVYPILVVGAAKLVVDDFPHATPWALFLALGAYGAALVIAPRIVRRS